MNILFEPFAYLYMVKAMCAAGLVGLLCGILSVFIMLRGWSLIGDALAHSVVPGVAIAASFALPMTFGAIVSGGLAVLAMLIIHHLSHLRTDAIIGLVFTSFLGLGVFILSVSPTSVNIQTIIFGHLLAINNERFVELVGLTLFSVVIVALGWRNFMLVFFDENEARIAGLPLTSLKVGFFAILSAATVAAMMTVGAFLVVALVIIPAASAYMLTKRFGRLIILSGLIGALTSLVSTYASFFLETSVGGLIVVSQALVFGVIFFIRQRSFADDI